MFEIHNNAVVNSSTTIQFFLRIYYQQRHSLSQYADICWVPFYIIGGSLATVVLEISRRSPKQDKPSVPMSSTTEFYEKIATAFSTRYKQLVLQLSRAPGDEGVVSILQRNEFAREIERSHRSLCLAYENHEWQTAVMDTIDLGAIYANVDAMPRKDPDNDDEYKDNLVKELLRYFKQDFFKWCDKPECPVCHSKEHQQFTGGQSPTPEEARYRCAGVEVYTCTQCHSTTRFPRYNDPVKLLETRQGRCGEWCNVFTLILKSFGLDVRYVQNKEDHVWNEYYSRYLQRWVHVDSCEQSFDEPHIYAVNWNKKMSYCIAYGIDGVHDVSKRYIVKNALPRTLISERDLRRLCEFLTAQVRRHLPDDELYEMFRMDECDRFASSPSPLATSVMGRQSGSAEWTAMRGEAGK